MDEDNYPFHPLSESFLIHFTLFLLTEMFIRPLSPLFFITCSISAGYARGPEAERGVNYDNKMQRSSAQDLYPVEPTIGQWTTSKSLQGALPIDDATFRSVNILSGTTRRVLTAPDGVVSMEAFYPSGSYNPSHTPRGGFSFYAPGPGDVDLTTAREATFAYTVLFPAGFDWVKGGKLPGFCAYPFLVIYIFSWNKQNLPLTFCLTVGGRDFDTAIGCSGGRKATDCFSVRLMWRKNGMGEFYTYLPPFTIPGYGANEAQCHVPPYSECNPQYGNSIGRGAFSFTPSERGTVAMRVLLNDAGVANGEIQLWYNGASVISLGGLIIRDSDEGRIRGLMMQTFFGGKWRMRPFRLYGPTIRR